MAKDLRPTTLSSAGGTASVNSSSLSPLLVANHYMRNRSSLVSAISTPRLFSTAPPTGPTPPPPGPPPPGATTAGPAAPGTASAARLPVSFKNYPARYALAFVAIHPTIAWGLMTPMYFLCHYTSLSTLLLAGPGGGAVLNTRIPSFLPASAIYGLREARARHELHNPGGSDPTVEEWMEMAIRKFASSSWQVAKGIRNLVTNVKGSVDGDFSPPGFDLKTMKRVQKVAADVQAQGLDGFKGDANEKKSWWHGYVKNRAEEIRFREVADGVAAYILIKVSPDGLPRASRGGSVDAKHEN